MVLLQYRNYSEVYTFLVEEDKVEDYKFIINTLERDWELALEICNVNQEDIKASEKYDKIENIIIMNSAGWYEDSDFEDGVGEKLCKTVKEYYTGYFEWNFENINK